MCNTTLLSTQNVFLKMMLIYLCVNNISVNSMYCHKLHIYMTNIYVNYNCFEGVLFLFQKKTTNNRNLKKTKTNNENIMKTINIKDLIFVRACIGTVTTKVRKRQTKTKQKSNYTSQSILERINIELSSIKQTITKNGNFTFDICINGCEAVQLSLPTLCLIAYCCCCCYNCFDRCQITTVTI